MLKLERIKRTDERLLLDMMAHYSAPGGFVGRNICYAVTYDGTYYGGIVGGSTPRHLPLREVFIGPVPLNNIVNNLFYHVERKNGVYPVRNFTIKALRLFELSIVLDWRDKYGDEVKALESLVELPRTGGIYRRSGWYQLGQTKGYTCKRTSGVGTDSWSGKRVWNTTELRPKLYFCKPI